MMPDVQVRLGNDKFDDNEERIAKLEEELTLAFRVRWGEGAPRGENPEGRTQGGRIQGGGPGIRPEIEGRLRCLAPGLLSPSPSRDGGWRWDTKVSSGLSMANDLKEALM